MMSKTITTGNSINKSRRWTAPCCRRFPKCSGPSGRMSSTGQPGYTWKWTSSTMFPLRMSLPKETAMKKRRSGKATKTSIANQGYPARKPFAPGKPITTSDFLMWAVFSRVILEMGMALFFVKMEKIWQDSDRRKN